MNRIIHKVLLLAGLSPAFIQPAMAACPFGIDCKPAPCGTPQQQHPAAGYAPAFQAAYGNVSAAPGTYGGTVPGAPFQAGLTYATPPCDPSIVPEEKKPVILPVPLPDTNEAPDSDTEQDKPND